MPVVSTFYGIKVTMYFGDHPPAHFHAQIGEFQALVSIETGDILKGSLPRTAQRLVKEWTELHREELAENWTRAMNDELPYRIEGLS
jgi:Domain of unknown function (DUF4160)